MSKLKLTSTTEMRSTIGVYRKDRSEWIAHDDGPTEESWATLDSLGSPN